MDILLKSLLGGVMTAVIMLLSKRGNVLPGILPLFPTFVTIALLVAGAKNDPAAFRETCLAGLKTVPAYVAFVIICYASVNKFGYKVAILCGLFSWGVTAFVSFYVLQRF